ncbi:MAG: hypothetical protein A2Y14_00050 [Verrucomicrobia bacterium GWF2_51_19]|nr:MAG: hypothetical protein A2Y14_00050 [Verrucomicrobia bacterium GWF2_51_19]HCJ11880.1 hypothetical protein [Opitutae bacterium]
MDANLTKSKPATRTPCDVSVLDRCCLKAFIFDLDGTLVDSMPLYFEAWTFALQSQHTGLEPDEELFYSWGGRSFTRSVADFEKHHNVKLDCERAERDLYQYVVKKVPTIRAKDDVLSLANTLTKHFPVAIVTGNKAEMVHLFLTQVGATHLAKILVSQGDTLLGKPYADPYLLAAQKMNVLPQHCLVFEDSETGFQGATAAGMPYVDATNAAQVEHVTTFLKKQMKA